MRRHSQQPGEAGGEVVLHLVQGHPLLGHRVALADGDRLVVQGVEVDGDAVRRADLVLATVAAADRLGVVEVGVPAARGARPRDPAPSAKRLVAGQRQHRDLDRRQPRVEPQHGALVHPALGVGGLVLDVGLDQERHQRAGQTGRGLDHVRHVPLARAPGRSRTGPRRSARCAWTGRSRSGWRRPPAHPSRRRRSRSGTRCRPSASSSGTASPSGARSAAGCPGRCPGRRTSGCARRSSTGATPRRCRARRRTPSPSARTRGCGR